MFCLSSAGSFSCDLFYFLGTTRAILRSFHTDIHIAMFSSVTGKCYSSYRIQF